MSGIQPASGAGKPGATYEIQQAEPGASRTNPSAEEEELEEETYLYTPGSHRTRVISSFLFYSAGELVYVDAKSFAEEDFSRFEVVAIVATIHGKEGLFAQCAWFGGHNVDWFWARLPVIQRLEVREDIRFRRGEKCVWLTTPYAEYAMLLPHKLYADLWEQSLSNMGPSFLSAKTGMWPMASARPAWWDERWRDSWPFEDRPPLKRRASTDTSNEMGDSSEEIDDTRTVPQKWLRLGPKGDRSRPGEPSSHLSHLSPWQLDRDSGMFPSVAPLREGKTSGPSR